MQNSDIDVNASDENGFTALMHACKKNHEDFVILLLKNPLTDLTKTDNDENSAQDLAKQQGNENISQLIKGFMICNEVPSESLIESAKH